MNRRISGILALVVVSSLALATSLYSQAKQDPKTGLWRVEGAITAVDSAKSILTVKQAGHANVTWSVAYGNGTTFTWQNADAKVEDAKVGRQVICIGKIVDPEKAKTHLAATRVEIRK